NKYCLIAYTFFVFVLFFIAQSYGQPFLDPNNKLTTKKTNEKKTTSCQRYYLPKVAIIIDDLGFNLSKGENALRLPGDITYAVIPNTPYSKQLAQRIKIKNQELILHIPMSNIYHSPLEKGGLTSQLT